MNEANSGDQSYDYDEIEQFINPSIENYTETKKSRIISHSHRRSLSTAKRCIPYSEKYLYQLLERTGMLNQWLMANNPEEAGRNFARSYKNFFKTKFDYFDSPQDDDGLPSDVDHTNLYKQFEDVSLPLTCNDLCQNIIWKLNEALIKEKNDTLSLSVPFLDDAQPHIINTSLINSSSNCQSGMFIPIGKCIPQGAEEFDDHSKLCTSCHGVYMLGKMCFPRFINAVRCESQIQTSGCIFDKISTQAHGSCYMRTLTLQVLRNRGDEKCHEWHHEYIQVPTSCECQLDTESILLSAVKL
uniref:Bursicon subunit alpha n=1 Tax=Elaeophora elaphi TaxID=1147741 RepID=A0A0R3RUT3_9BILA